MPYPTLSSLPDDVKKLPKHGQEIWQAAFNNAIDEYKGDEERAFATAWAAVKEQYAQNEAGEWQKKVAKTFHFDFLFKSSVAKDSLTIEGIASTGEMDRDSDIIDPESWKRVIPRFLKGNPVLLWDHGNDTQMQRKPMGHVVDATVTEDGLWVRAEVTDPWAIEQIKAGNIRAFSWSGTASRKGPKFEVTDWYELSLVSIPANPKALFSIAKALNGLEKELIDPTMSEEEKKETPKAEEEKEETTAVEKAEEQEEKKAETEEKSEQEEGTEEEKTDEAASSEEGDEDKEKAVRTKKDNSKLLKLREAMQSAITELDNLMMPEKAEDDDKSKSTEVVDEKYKKLEERIELLEKAANRKGVVVESEENEQSKLEKSKAERSEKANQQLSGILGI